MQVSREFGSHQFIFVWDSLSLVAERCQWCSQWRRSKNQRRTRVVAQFRVYSQPTSEHEVQKWSWDAEWYNGPPSLPHWLWLGWWIVSLAIPFILYAVEIFLTEFVMASGRVLSIYPKIISFDVSTHMETAIPTMSRKGFFEVAYLSRFIRIYPPCLFITDYISPCRRILIFSHPPHPLNLSVMKMKMVMQENSNASPIRKEKRPSAMLQTFLAWMVELPHVQ